MFPVVWYPTGNKSSCIFYLVLYISLGLASWASILMSNTRGYADSASRRGAKFFNIAKSWVRLNVLDSEAEIMIVKAEQGRIYCEK